MSDGPLTGNVALVTGASRRIGREIALALAGAGAKVAITYHLSESDAADTRDAMSKAGAQAMSLHCDVTREESVREAVAKTVEHFGGIDLLVNNAGTFSAAALEEITVEQWDAAFTTNTRGPFLMAKAAHATLKARHGRIINIGSLGGMRAWATHGNYCASKAALHMLSQTMAKAWAPEISVNCVAPGMIVMDPSDAGLAGKTPMQRDGTATDVAAAVMFFATCPGFITGQILAVDGGLGL